MSVFILRVDMLDKGTIFVQSYIPGRTQPFEFSGDDNAMFFLEGQHPEVEQKLNEWLARNNYSDLIVDKCVSKQTDQMEELLEL